MRRCFIHIGTHKTGTTSLQATLAAHAADLARHGFLYPRTGIPPGAAGPGHHNIAWEMNGSERFRPSCGTIQDLFREIDGSELDIILSSEDFECAAWHPAKFETLINGLKQRATEVAIVVYLRNQPDYARSLYLEMLQHGYDGSFNDFLSQVLDQRAFRWKSWVFAFCYRDLLEQLPAETQVIARSYEQTGDVIPDFVKILGLNAADLTIRAEPYANRQLPISAAFVAFYRNRTGRRLDRAGFPIMPKIAQAFDNAQMLDATYDRILAAFRESNRHTESHCGIVGLVGERNSAPKLATTGRPCLEVIFSGAMVRLMDEALEASAQHGRALLDKLEGSAAAAGALPCGSAPGQGDSPARILAKTGKSVPRRKATP